MMAITWLVNENPEPRFARLPKWQRSAGVADDGAVYVPAIMAASETEVFLCAGFDGADLLRDERGHLFARSDWMVREFPDTAQACRSIERRVAQYLRDGG